MSLSRIEKVLQIPKDLKYPKWMEEYFQEILNKVKEAYLIAMEARKIGIDPKPFPEIKLASDMASRVEALVGPPTIAERIRALIKEGLEVEEIAFIVAREIAEGKYGIEHPEQRASQAIKTAMAVLAGITAAPIEGITHVKIRNDGHLAIYYAGPIRSAGGTEAALTVVIADVVRRTLNLPPYKPTKREIERFVEEVFLYDRYMNLQNPPERDKIEYVLEHLPVEITGEGTIDVEVSGRYKNMPNIETNKVRGGAVLVLNDGVILKAKKILKIIKKIGLDGWGWLEKIAEEKGKSKESGVKIKPNPKYLSDVIAGRPVLASPSKIGAFRLRYGRARNTGLAALGIHPSLMILTDNFLSIGIQLKTERPGKGAIIMPVDTILPPLVKLKDGSVKFVESVDEAKKIKKEVEKILFLGDLLVAIGEFLENNHIILPSPIVEEWWEQELERALAKTKEKDVSVNVNEVKENAAKKAHIAIELTKKYNIPLHPRFTYFWRNISGKELELLSKYIKSSEKNEFPLDSELKEILEKLFLPHLVKEGKILIDREDYEILKTILAIIRIDKDEKEIDALTILNKRGWLIEDKYPVFIGARIGRPEKAKPRKMKPPVNVLFPMGDVGAKSRSIIRAIRRNPSLYTNVEAVAKKCPTCNEVTYLNKCPKCGKRTIQIYVCERCGRESLKYYEKCQRCGGQIRPYKKYKINLADALKKAVNNIRVTTPKEIKGVKGLTSSNKTPEPLEKGILRSKYDLYVFKDGTIRFDATDCPLTHFKPKEIGVSVEKLRELGYTIDINGEPLTSEDQILELKPQDIIINEDGAEYLLKVANFIDELLTKIYGLEPYYKLQTKEDLIGHLVIGLAPHTSVGIIGRIIGFTKAQCSYAHPYWHAAKRRNCDGDEDAIILLLDGLINFSRDYLPSTRGGFMDAPLVVTAILNPLEVDSEVYNMDATWRIPLEFYHKSKEYPDPSTIEGMIDNVEKRLGTERQYYEIGFTHDTSDINNGNTLTAYKSLKTMKEKIIKQFNTMKMIAAIDIYEIADKILEAHLLPDVLGNLRSFGTQKFRCVDCNAKFRRPLLGNKCPKCGGNIIQTVFRKTVLKYVPLIEEIISTYGTTGYMDNRIKIIKTTDIKVLSDDVQMLEDFLNGESGGDVREDRDRSSVKGVKKRRKISLDDLL